MELAGVGIAGTAACRLDRSSLLRLRDFGLGRRRREDRRAVADDGLGLGSLGFAGEGIDCIGLEVGRRIGFGVGIGYIGRRSRLDLDSRTYRLRFTCCEWK